MYPPRHTFVKLHELEGISQTGSDPWLVKNPVLHETTHTEVSPLPAVWQLALSEFAMPGSLVHTATQIKVMHYICFSAQCKTKILEKVLFVVGDF